MAKPITVAAPAIKNQVKTGRTVTVACKIQNGLVLQLQRQETYQEPTMNGLREQTRWVPTGERHIVAGPAYPVQPPRGYPRQVPIEGGFALTRGIPADFWEQWVEQNKLLPAVTSGAIFAMTAMQDVTAKARESEDLLTGFEPLQVDAEKITDSRMPKPQNPNVFYSEQAAREARNA